ncbi:MAG: methyltransferase domain-containing protein [Candidatus Dormibacteraeota bacterium]|nr:methyltransferase domain-containing protein [Candidatus Dormibacteraeota bacterium]
MAPGAADVWSPAQYERFRAEREQPFWDLLRLLDVAPNGRVVDLGCGTGMLTRELHRAVRARETVGVDSSDSMLARAAEIDEDGLQFVKGDIGRWSPDGACDVVFSNAALQWLDDHPRLFKRLRGFLAPNGVLAVQVPSNYDHESHTVAAEVALEEPFASATGGYTRESTVLQPEAYAELLYALGLRDLHVRLQVYCHELSSTPDVVEWVRGTLLTDYQPRMPEAMFDEYVTRYRQRLLDTLGDQRPYLFAFKRILMRARAAP